LIRSDGVEVALGDFGAGAGAPRGDVGGDWKAVRLIPDYMPITCESVNSLDEASKSIKKH
jgi:hypothetical protein